MTIPQATLGQSYRADGSADYSHDGYRIVCAVNGPVEVQRRDEIPDEAAIEVNVRPAVGVGGPKERHIETLIHSTLRHVILTHMHPRSLIQVTLQVLTVPEGYVDLRPSSHIAILAPLLNAATLALLSASIPMQTTLTSVTVAIPRGKEDQTLVLDPTPAQVRKARSVHVFAFDSAGQAVLCESEGSFTAAAWAGAEAAARAACLERVPGAEEGAMDVDSPEEDVDESEDGGEDGDGGVSLDPVDGGGASARPSAMRGRGDLKGLLGVVQAIVGDKMAKDRAWKDGI